MDWACLTKPETNLCLSPIMIWSLNNSTRLKCPSIRFPLILLLIVAKAQVREDGLCYIGWDMDRHKLVRPVLRIRSFRWLRKDPELHIGEQRLFKIKSLHLEGTPYPHRMDDVLVDYDEPYEQAADNSDVVELYDILIRLSHQTVKKVFDDMDPLHGKYFLEHTKCPSVGIYKCKRENITTEREERRCKITEDGLIVYNYKITAVDNELPDIDKNENVLVILGLARPSRGRY